MKKRRYIPTWVIVLSAILASCAISGICCILIFKPELPHFPTAPPSQSEHIEDGGEPAPENNVGEGNGATSNPNTESPEEEIPPMEEPDAGDVQSEPPPHDSEAGAASGGKDESGELPSADKKDAGAVTEPDTENQESPLSGVVTDLGGVGEEDARYKIETLETRVGSLPCTVYVRYCKRNPFSGAWEVVKEKGDPYYDLDEVTDPNADPLADVTLINIYDRSIARGERCGYCWYGDSFFEAREQWQFFSGGRFRTAGELKQEESEWQNQQGF